MSGPDAILNWKVSRSVGTAADGRFAMELEKTSGEAVLLAGPAKVVRELAELAMEAAAAREHRRALIASKGIGYWVSFAAGGGNFGSMHVTLPAPGIASIDDLFRLQRDLSTKFQTNVVIIGWCEMEGPRRVFSLVPSPQPVNLA
jgi:hypothetical protein